MVADEADQEVDTKWITEPTLFDEVNDFSIKFNLGVQDHAKTLSLGDPKRNFLYLGGAKNSPWTSRGWKVIWTFQKTARV